MAIEYLSVEAARDQPGLRLALTAGVPGPYSMAAREIMDLKNVPFVPVEQVAAGANEELVAWTGHRNAPIAVYENEAPRAGWLDILNLAERLGDGPSLLPDKLEERMAMVGLVNEMIGENGMLWQMRIILFGLGGPDRAAKEAERNPMYKDYGYSEAALATAEAKVHAVLDAMDSQLARQRGAGSEFFFGARMSAADVYWAFVSQLFETLPEPLCPMPSFLRKSYGRGGELVGGCSAELLAHRDMMFAEHLATPLTF